MKRTRCIFLIFVLLWGLGRQVDALDLAIGMHGGKPNYAEEDYFRKEMGNTGSTHGGLFLELYAFERLGLGVRSYTVEASLTETIVNSEQTKQYYGHSSVFYTLQLILIKFGENGQLGIMGGGGHTTFEYRYHRCEGEGESGLDYSDFWSFYVSLFTASLNSNFECENTLEDKEFKTRGPSDIKSVFLDLGGEAWGIRLAYDDINVYNLEEFEGNKPELSSGGFYLGLRYLF